MNPLYGSGVLGQSGLLGSVVQFVAVCRITSKTCHKPYIAVSAGLYALSVPELWASDFHVPAFFWSSA